MIYQPLPRLQTGLSLGSILRLRRKNSGSAQDEVPPR